MARGDGTRQGAHQLRRPAGRLRLAEEAVGEGAAIQVFEDEVGEAARLAGAVDRDDVRVWDAGGGDRLGAEPGPLRGPRVTPAQDHLDRDRPVQSGLLSAIDHPHASAADLLLDVEPGITGGCSGTATVGSTGSDGSSPRRASSRFWASIFCWSRSRSSASSGQRTLCCRFMPRPPLLIPRGEQIIERIIVGSRFVIHGSMTPGQECRFRPVDPPISLWHIAAGATISARSGGQ